MQLDSKVNKLSQDITLDNNYQLLILTYNFQDTVIDLLNSIEYQVDKFGENKNLHVDIFDDGSFDNTVLNIRKFITDSPKKGIYSLTTLKENQGLKKMNELVLSSINYEKYLIIDGDDIFASYSLYDYLDFCWSNNQYDFVLLPNFFSRNDGKIIINYSTVLMIFFNFIGVLNWVLEKRNPIFNVGSYIRFNDELLSKLIDEWNKNSNVISPDYFKWKFLRDNKRFNFTIYHLPIMIYRPKYQSLLKLKSYTNKGVKIGFMIKNFLLRIASDMLAPFSEHSKNIFFNRQEYLFELNEHLQYILSLRVKSK